MVIIFRESSLFQGGAVAVFDVRSMSEFLEKCLVLDISNGCHKASHLGSLLWGMLIQKLQSLTVTGVTWHQQSIPECPGSNPNKNTYWAALRGIWQPRGRFQFEPMIVAFHRHAGSDLLAPCRTVSSDVG